MSLIGIAFAIIAACGLAGQALLARIATRQGRSSDLVLIVILVNVALLIPLVFLVVPNPTLTPRAIFMFAAAGIIGTMLGRMFLYAGIKRVGASRAEPIKASMPVYATILAVVLLGESVSDLQFLGVLLIVVGIALVSWESGEADRLAGKDTPWIGLALPLIAAIFFGLEPIFASFGFDEGSHVLVGLSVKTLAALGVYVPYLFLRGEVPALGNVRIRDLRWHVLVGLSNTVFLLGYYAGLSVAPVSVVVPIVQSSPLIVIAVSAVFLKGIERVTPRLVTAAGIIVIGGITVTLTG